MKDTQTDHRMADTRDMVMVHAAFLREFRLAPGLVRQAGGERRVAQVAGHVELMLHLLEHHHTGEDRLVWPRLRERLGPDELETPAMEAQHDLIAEVTASGTELLTRWRRAPDEHRDRLAGCLQNLHDAVEEHLRDEEETVLPLVEVHLTEAEWQQVGEAAMAKIPKPKLPLVVGMIAYGNDPALVQIMLAPAPRPVRTLTPRIGSVVYGRYARRIHGTPTPR